MAEETLYDSEAMRRFAGIELADDRIPDETNELMRKVRHVGPSFRIKAWRLSNILREMFFYQMSEGGDVATKTGCIERLHIPRALFESDHSPTVSGR